MTFTEIGKNTFCYFVGLSPNQNEKGVNQEKQDWLRPF
jgi:hypothetical protein